MLRDTDFQIRDATRRIFRRPRETRLRGRCPVQSRIIPVDPAISNINCRITTELDENGIPLHPTDVLISVVVAFLTPMFLGCGNLQFAQMAAMETVNSFRVRHQADLIVVAQIIAFGLATLGSLSLSMTDDIELPMILRLRNNANALNRSEHRQRRIRAEYPPERRAEPPQPQPEPQPAPAQIDPTPLPPQPQTTHHNQPHPNPPAATPAPTSDAHAAEAFAAFNAFMQDATSQLPNRPARERPPMGMRAAALASSATDLLTGIPPAPLGVPIRRGGG